MIMHIFAGIGILTTVLIALGIIVLIAIWWDDIKRK